MMESDAPAVVDLIGRSLNCEESTQASKTLRFHFNCARQGIEDGRTYGVVTEHGTITGIVGLHHYQWGPAENVWLAWFAVDPSVQGEGLGKALFTFVLDVARREGYQKLFVETYSTGEFASARIFYQKMGMVPAGIVTPYLSGGGNMIVYYKDLTINDT
jgi:GNAT superfamily N-acetyltransferase